MSSCGEYGEDDQNKKMRIRVMMTILKVIIAVIATVKAMIQSEHRGADMT